MKYFLSLFLILFFLPSCNQGEGLGGSSSLEGYVYQIAHSDDNFTFQKDTFPAAKKDVYLIFGNNDADYFGDDVETNNNGLYRFDYLRKGNYRVYSYSEYPDGRRAATFREVKVGSGGNKADTLFIHTGKAYGTSMIKGKVFAMFYDGTKLVDSGDAIDADVYINRAGEEMFFERIRVGSKGIFIFQKILPGKYEIWVTSEDPVTRKLTPIKQYIEVTETETLYEIEEKFTIKVRA
jgi:hypothetical protein